MSQMDFFRKVPPKDEHVDRFKAICAEDDASPKLVKKFLEYHEKNPGVFKLFVRFANEAKASGRPRFSHWMIINRIRWYSSIETTGDQYKISNDYNALYPRLLLAYHPEFEDFFELKQMKIHRKAARE